MHKTFDKIITKNLAIASEVGWGEQDPLCIMLMWSRKCDHAGLNFIFQIWKFCFEFRVYDIRHWDEEKECFI
jgi:hypothetical protein